MTLAITSLDDDTLVRQSQDELPYIATSYEELVKRYQKPVYAMCRRYLSVESDAEDATQDVFMKVFHTLPSFEFRSTFSITAKPYSAKHSVLTSFMNTVMMTSLKTMRMSLLIPLIIWKRTMTAIACKA